ncbi:hypothetical protein [Pseudoxanthomonas winnipegensis]|uniref:Uncharacterized protein n=1 Tax=Pseudoxanthomonas winnipegensis TaxID=2480810 RepID=A0A4Q8M572_9GAMM|nr:hypothetical protein [Pseudoxanthomonas winnipegensis]TAA41549.1 hypothetical protein EA655_11445 [Pseudoxanthomonas winnipegensis]
MRKFLLLLCVIPMWAQAESNMQQSNGRGELIAVAHLDFKIVIPRKHENGSTQVKVSRLDQLHCCTAPKDGDEKPQTVVMP